MYEFRVYSACVRFSANMLCVFVHVVCRFGELFDRLLSTDHVHNVVGVLCYLQSVTELLSTATSALSAATSTTESTSASSCNMSSIVLPTWMSVVAALQRHLNRVSGCLCNINRYEYKCLYTVIMSNFKDNSRLL